MKKSRHEKRPGITLALHDSLHRQTNLIHPDGIQVTISVHMQRYSDINVIRSLAAGIESLINVVLLSIHLQPVVLHLVAPMSAAH